MKLLIEINDKVAGYSDVERFDKPYILRKAGRAVIFNDKGEIAFQYVKTHDIHKLPGGGIDPGETIEEGLRREIREEVGCEIDITGEIGMTIEYRNEEDKLQISYCYLAKLVGEVGEPEWMEDEIEDGYESIWVPIDEAIRLSEKDKGKDFYSDPFITLRLRAILKEAKKHA